MAPDEVAPIAPAPSAAGPDVLVVCGIPGSGKTTFAKWLEQRRYLRVAVDEILERAPVDWSLVERAVVAAINGDDGPLDAAATPYIGVVIEWGFHPSDLPRLRAMVDRGYAAWYFDGDRQTALRGWRNSNPTQPEGLWHEQMTRLDRVATEIAVIFGPNIIESVSASAGYAPPEVIDAKRAQLARGR